MVDIVVDEKVVNKFKEIGTIVSVDDQYIHVSYQNRNAKLPLNAFEQGLLKYQDTKIQSDLDKAAMAKLDEERRAVEKEKKAREQMEAQAPIGVKFNSVSIRLEPASVSLSSVKGKHKNTVQEIFNQCDQDIDSYYGAFHPTMKYITPRTSVPHYKESHYDPFFFDHTPPSRTEYYRSRYCTGFVTKYENAYVLRVLSRNDVYTIGMMGGFTVTNSDTTEILRIIGIDGETYYFSKHLSPAGGTYKNTKLYKKWQSSQFANLVILDEVVRNCDCRYLNEHVEQKDVNCSYYAKLFMAACFDGKAEIIFKNELFSSFSNIDNTHDYLKEFTSKQIDFASKHNVINALPIIKQFGIFDPTVLSNIEALKKPFRNSKSTYDMIVELFIKNDLDLAVLDQKLIRFLKKEDALFDLPSYTEYMRELLNIPDVTVKDIFDKDYQDRAYVLMMDRSVWYSKETSNQYEQIAQELSWIDREENGYYIFVPKTIPEFKNEGQKQNICVYFGEFYLKVINHESIIVFLRKEIDKPFVTIEYDYETFEVIQDRKKFNQNPDDELHQFIVDLGKRLRLEMLSRE